MSEDFGWINVLAGFGLGLAVGFCVSLLAQRWQRLIPLTLGNRARRYSYAALGALALFSITLMVSGRLAPTAADVSVPPAAPDMARGGVATEANGSPSAGSSAAAMEVSVAALGARLAAEGGPDADWELLAQSYEFLGRASEAALARQHKVSTRRDLQDAVAVSARILGPGARSATVSTMPAQGDVAALLARAEEHRRKREFKQACEVYALVAKRGGMTADSWADYADAQAGISGALSGEPARAIEAALAADPKHPKALWLKASLAHEEGRYAEALGTWKQLLAVVQPGSSDARIVTANIAEATRLASN